MKKHIMLHILGLAVTVTLLGCSGVQIGERDRAMSREEEAFEEIIAINFQLLGSQTIDTTAIRRWIGQSSLEGNEPLTFFFQFSGEEKLDGELAETLNLNLQNLELIFEDYTDKYFIVTVGRQLAEIWVESPRSMNPFITFAESYNQDVLYFYEMDPIMFWPSDLGRNAFYVMHGGYRRYLGDSVQSLNYSLLIQEIEDFMDGEINFQLLESHAVDISGIRERFGILEWQRFIFFEQVENFTDFVRLAYTEYNLDLTDIALSGNDYQDKYIVITIGKELSEIRYRFLDKQQQPKGLARANVTFEAEYSEGILYIYAMDRIPLGNSILGGSEYFSFFTLHDRRKFLLGDSIATLNCGDDELIGEFFARHFREVFELMRAELAE